MTGDNSGNPSDGASYMGSTPEAPDANTNLDPSLTTGPQTGADQAAMRTIHEQGTEAGGMPDPARQSDNSGMVSPTGDTGDADIIGASGNDRQSERTGN